jgi:hypothetical protein
MHFDPSFIYHKWEELTSANPVKMVDHAYHIVPLFFEQAVSPEIAYPILLQIRQKIPSPTEKFKAIFASTIFKLSRLILPKNLAVLHLALNDFNEMFSVCQHEEVVLEAIPMFVSQLNQILKITASNPHLLNVIKSIIQQFVLSASTENAMMNKSLWSDLLKSLCQVIIEVAPENIRILEKLAFEIFTLSIKSPNQTLKDLTINEAIPFLLTRTLEGISPHELQLFINEIPFKTLQEMVTDLCNDRALKILHLHYLNSLAAARLVRWMKHENTIPLTIPPNPLLRLPPFSSTDKKLISIQFSLRYEWIFASQALKNYFEQTQQLDHFKILTNSQQELAKDFTQLILSYIKDDLGYAAYSPFLIKTLSLNMDILRVIHQAFQIPINLNPQIAASLTNLKTLIENKLHVNPSQEIQ